MRSLFLKFFLSFLLINILFVAIALSLAFLRDREFPPEAHRQFARQLVEEYGSEAIEIYETRGSAALNTFIDKLNGRRQVKLSLFDAHGQPLTKSHRHMPRRMQMMAHRALESGQVVFPMMGDRNLVSAGLQGKSGRRYAVTIALKGEPEPEQLLKSLGRGFLGWRLMILMAISAVVCFWLARSFSSPISRLRKATHQLADGDLGIRIGDQVKGKNEIAGLARDFDHMAERIEDLVSAQQRLLRDISHELRSPLARLGVALELARQEGKPEIRQKALQRIELEAERMNEMIGQLLNLTRLESGARELQRENFDLAELITELVQDADYEAKNRNCRVEFSDNIPCPFYGSQQLLARALENVIRNAVKYTAEGTAVQVKLGQQEQQICIQILDQGPGVPEESLEKLFEPFYRVADDRDRKSGGTGIGLAIADRSIRLHNGRIKAQNRTEGGLEVEIYLPQASN
ncbi:two-component system, OmpR family, sensor histidine kinase CpxA [Malonomonas rubra DSM 5091]|uniref:histidine kinase n=1 Tax=Malonomonas rubra DSM 5091 TaxID=1122189 RepID=A0A1M6IQG7_MALRU|nr:ATP-binding protein [Malonomonas rubra]SHJ36682.1 two-component system, OmpR family, sensor histidine kinase CpxA [Malonomonas rubra DSM 5091]